MRPRYFHFDAKDEQLDLTMCPVSVQTCIEVKKSNAPILIKNQDLEENKRNVRVIPFCMSDLTH